MVRKNMFEPSVLINYLDISDINWFKKSIKDDKNNKEINIKKYFSKISNIKNNKLRKKNLIIIADYIYKNKNKLYFITDKDYKCLYISVGICNPSFWIEFTTKTSLKNNLKKIIKKYSEKENLLLGFTYNYNGIVYSKNTSEEEIKNIKNLFLSNNLSDNLIWGSAWKDYPFRNDYIRTKNINFKKSMNKESLKQLNDIYKVSCKTKFSKSIITFEHDKDIITVKVQYNSINFHKNINKKINDKFNANYPINIPLDVLGILINYKITDLTEFLKLNYISDNKDNLAMKIFNNKQFKNDIEDSLIYIRDNIEDNKIKKYIKIDLKNIKKKINNKSLIRLKYKNSCKSNILRILDQKLGINI